MMEQKMQEQIEGALYHQKEFYDEMIQCSKEELYNKITHIEYQLNNLKEHGLGDSDCEKQIWILNRDYKIIKKIYDDKNIY